MNAEAHGGMLREFYKRRRSLIVHPLVCVQGLWVADTGSANGTFVNGRRIKSSRVREVEKGIVRFGDVKVRVKPAVGNGSYPLTKTRAA